ncbi:hypothetical protein NU08_0239 [Flavobacterium anhuiense]|uniref:Uncharacterized protein n=2 Tax=Flavobacterium anhuiense TaxID=459526 RepID=A0A444W4X6_9FLAO|nr:hypothetical protein NU08_0239 [Flavobacterium anhuiense]
MLILLSFATYSCTADDSETTGAKTKVAKETPLTGASADGPDDKVPPPPPPEDN